MRWSMGRILASKHLSPGEGYLPDYVKIHSMNPETSNPTVGFIATEKEKRKYRVSWLESRLHYVEVDADDEFDAIEMAHGIDYEETGVG